MHKLMLTMVLAGECNEAQIDSQLNSSGISECLQPLGTWETIDVVLLTIGVALFWSALKSLFSKKRQSSRGERQGKRLQRLGTLVAIVGVADFFGMLTENGEPLDASELFGFPFPNGVSLILLSAALLFSIIGGSMRRRAQSRSSRPRVGASRFKGPAERHLSGDFSVGELRRALMLDAFEDPFQVSADDDWGGQVGRTCHYCNGEGCPQCGNTGSLG
ncbi:MAG: hypothetical protein CMB37_04585 [Euryarchaeota archaeon]|nr:hypothetical protein [Euryarchaeota archaeon]MED5486597.1 hypothetical protein [Candidatus Thermoplasmatota archaeon]